MSLRNFVPSYPQLSVNGPPPPHHQAHRVQALPVNVANALQQQISQQQAAAQQQSQGSAQSNQNSGGGNVQTAPSHEYHIAPCLPFQAPAGANLAQNFIRHMSNGGYAQAHPQSQQIYQTQGGPGVVQNQQQQQSNQNQSISNAVQQNQARLTPMSQPTAPSTPPTQQNQQINQSQQGPQYAVQIQQQGLPSGAGGAGNSRTPQYRQPSQVQRRNQPPQINAPYIYQQQFPYGFVQIPPGTHVRTPAYSYLQPFQPMFNNYAAAAPNYGQMAAPSNGQQRQSAPQTVAPSMAPQQVSEYTPSYVYEPSVMQAAQVPAQAPPPSQQPQKTVKKTGSKAIQIINPTTGKSIFDDDSAASATSGGSGSTGTNTGTAIATVDKAITASHNELNKDEAVDKETLTSTVPEPSTPVVSAMSDGPSVDITPKHQVNKIKKVKPPEPVVPVPILADPPKPTKPVEAEPETVVVPVQPITQDNENNNHTAVTLEVPNAVAIEPPTVEPEVVEVAPAVVSPHFDVNDTNNNNYQKVTQSEKSDEKEVKASTANVSKKADDTPQDSNNNSTDDKSVMTSPSIRQNVQAAPPSIDQEKEKVESPVVVVAPTDKVRKISVIDYVTGQWSPDNTEGKKYYTRDQLLKLKDQPIAGTPPSITKLPENVANTLMKNNKDFLTNTLNQTMPVSSMGGSMQRIPFDPINSIAPKFMPNQMGGRNPYQKRPSQQGNNKQAPGGGRGSQPGIIKLTLSLQDDVKLNEAENAWKPSHLTKKQDLTEEDRVTHDLLSRFRSMLNKLTAENFDLLVEQVKLYKIDTGERLDGVISLVFEKAISEPKFAPTYANLCKEVAFITTAPSGQGEGNTGKKNTLKVKLITQCQKEFERHKEESIVFNDIEDKLRAIENLPELERRDEEKSRLEEEHYRVRQRANGTVKFIGELFKIDMLTSKIMRACIDMLLQEVTEEKIERVCKLLTTIGGKMEKQDGRSSLDKYFSQLEEMIHPSHKVIKSSRIKFEIQNLQDLRNSGWKSRRQDMTPRTMDQIQMEAEHEQQMINYQTRQNAKDDRQRGGNQGGYNNNRRQQNQQNQDNDGWSVQQNNKSRAQPLQFNKISLPTMISEGPKLGNPTNYQSFMVQSSNKFSALPVDTEIDGPPRFGGGGSKNSSMERSGDRGSHYYGNGGNAPYSGRSSGSNQGSRNSSQIRSRDNSDGRGGPSRSLQAPPRHHQAPPSGGSSMSFSGAMKQPQKVSHAAPAEPMTREEVEKNFTEMLGIVDSYRDDKYTIDAAIAKLAPLNINKDVLVEIYNKYLDRKDIDRENLMMLICEMLKEKKLTREENRAALIEAMELAPDMLFDVPRVYEYIAQFFGELLIASALTFQDVYNICEAYIKETKDGDSVLRYIFTAIEKRHGAPKLQQVFASSNCKLELFISDGNLNRWLESNNFTNMVKDGTRGAGDVLRIKSMLDEKKGLEEIMNYISSNDCTKDQNFIHNLTKVVIDHCCEEYPASATQPSQLSYRLQNTRLENLSQLLQRYINNESQLELQCINALQHFANAREYPSGLLNSTFEILYDNDVLSVEAFEMWKNSKDQSEGKGVAICSTRQFFTKLAEDIDEDDPDYYGEEGETL